MGSLAVNILIKGVGIRFKLLQVAETTIDKCLSGQMVLMYASTEPGN